MSGVKKYAIRVSLLVVLLVLLLVPVVSAGPQGTDPDITLIQIVLYTKRNGETEVNYYLRWTETAPRDYVEMILDCWGGDLGYGDVTVYSEANRVFDLANDEDHGQEGESGAYHRHRLIFPETTRIGGDYELAIGYGSRLDTFPYGGVDGRADFVWQANPWPFPVDRYEIDWVAETMAGADFSLIEGDFSAWDETEQFDPSDWYGSRTAAVRLVKNNAPAGWTPVVAMSVPAGPFGISAPSTAPPATQAPVVQPTEVPSPVAAQPKGGISFCGGFFVVLILACVIGGGIAIWWFVSRKPRRPPVTPRERRRPVYEEPAVRREAKPAKPNIATDLTMAEVAYLWKAENDRIILSCVRGLESRGLIVVLDKDPLKLKIRPRKVQWADRDGELTRVDRAIIEAITDDGFIDPQETEVIVAAVRASAEMKLAEREADKRATEEYYEEKIRQLEREVREQRRPDRYLDSQSDIWFWLWLTERYRHDTEPRPGTYRYPVPRDSVYVAPSGDRYPVKDESFRQTIADFEKPRPGIASEITAAAALAARRVTGAAAGEEREPPPRPHDVCVKRQPTCVTRPVKRERHDACVHSDCVRHSKHDACVHSACVHSDCVRHSAHSAHSACVHRHSACVSRVR